ncbi:MAG: citrate transporter [Spirochaetales bacterium]|nr:citrate transporter [Spirochaetales bacterium]
MFEFNSITALVVFIAAYILFVVLPSKRPYIAIGGAVILLITQSISVMGALESISWNVMGIFIGTLFVADVFIESRVPAFVAELIVRKTNTVQWAILLICILTSFISAFVENVATVLIVAPIALALSDRLKISPVKMLIAIAIASNLQGTATLIGDPPSMLLGQAANMNFNDFFFYQGKPSIFFAVEIGAVFSFLVLYLFFKKNKEPMPEVAVEKVTSWVPTILLVALILGLASMSFVPGLPDYSAGVLCMVVGIVCLVWKVVVHKGPFWDTLKTLDWETTIFLIGVFVLVGSLSATGWIDRMADGLSHLIQGNLLVGYFLIVGVSVVFSAFVDNVPYLVAMLPLTASLSEKMGVPVSLLFFGLLIGASLGGNITPIGASANVVACGMLKKRGYTVKFWEFIKMGFPFTIVATIAGAIFVWFVWGP